MKRDRRVPADAVELGTVSNIVHHWSDGDVLQWETLYRASDGSAYVHRYYPNGEPYGWGNSMTHYDGPYAALRLEAEMNLNQVPEAS